MKTYPVFLVNLAGRRCVVLGGGEEAERKARELLAVEAAVRVVAETATPGLSALGRSGRLRWIRRDYRTGDLRGAFLAVASLERSLNPGVAAEARRERVLLNTMDDPRHCDFIAGSLVRRGPLTLAISTGGAAPALAVRLRQWIETALGPELGTLADLLGRLRRPLARRYADPLRRRRAWYDLVDSDLIDHASGLMGGRPRETPGRGVGDTPNPGSSPPDEDPGPVAAGSGTAEPGL